jgi:2-polyprenyl-6-methoxyphenol hydroxylase-like FAD-dependent oxidoreductase
MRQEDTYDVAIVGGGIAGMYAAHRVLRDGEPHARVVLFEAAHRLGGRVRTARFCGVEVPLGAGVGRVGKDRLLLGLCDELGVAYDVTPMRVAYARPLRERLGRPPLEVLARVLGDAAPGRTSGGSTFREVATRRVGRAAYDDFRTVVGFTDYEGMGHDDAVRNYGFDDTFVDEAASPKREVARVPWAALLRALRARLAAAGVDIRLRAPVRRGARPARVEGGWSVGGVHARVVVLAGDVHTLRALAPDPRLYAETRSQPFLRAYAQLECGRPLVRETTVVHNALQKVLPVDPGKGLYMVAYCDNANAEALRHAGARDFSRLLGDALGVAAPRVRRLRVHYWPAGTHFRTPLSAPVERLQRPADGMFVVGEAVAVHNGWTEGALESVHRIVPDLSHVMRVNAAQPSRSPRAT